MKPIHRFTPKDLGIERDKPLQVAAFLLLLAFAATVPIPWGGVLLGGKLKIEVAAFVITAMILASRASLSPLRQAVAPFSAVAALAMLGAIQLIPLPSPVLEWIAPLSAAVYRESNAVLAAFGRPPLTARISIVPFETAQATLLVLALGALALSSALILQSRRRRRAFFAVVIGSALIQSIWATSTFAGRTTGRLSGSFVNPNHFAGYLGIALALAFGVMWREALYNGERGRHARDRTERLERRLLPAAASALLWGVIAVAIGLTKSRGGIAAVAITSVAMLTAGIMHRPIGRRTRAAILIIVLLGAGFAITTAATTDEPLIRYLESDPREIDSDMRVALWRSSLTAWKLSPIVGSGLGTFREAFRHVQPREITGLVEQAHSDPLQLLVTGGWIGLALGLICALLTLRMLVRLWLKQPHREEGAFILAAMGALAGLLVHGLAEFNFSIPAIPATLACVVGMAIAAGLHGTETATVVEQEKPEPNPTAAIDVRREGQG